MTLAGLAPEAVWRHFEALSAIPRPSQAEAKVLGHLKVLADGWGLAWSQDRVGNLVIRKPASPGREDRPAVVLQAHLDMVCEQDRGGTHDFTKDPLKLVVEDGWVRAEGTTLGADDGIGVAVILAVLEDPSLVHGPLEALFTVDEEMEMTGAAGLDASLITGRTVLNLDGEGTGVFVVGSAGGGTTTGRLPVTLAHADAPAGWSVSVGGLEGGHSGTEIGRQVGNALVLAARFASSFLAAEAPGTWQLARIEGGDKDNAIPREALVILAGPADGAALEAFAARVLPLWAAELGAEGDRLSLRASPVARPDRTLSPASQQSFLDLLTALPDGVLGRSKVVPGLVETSCNLGRVRLDDGLVTVVVSERSSDAGLLADLIRRVRATFRLAGGEVSQAGDYPPWTPAASGRLRTLAPDLWQRVTGTPARVEVIHAGLECGFLAQTLPGADIVSFGANLVDIHTPRERVEVASVAPLMLFTTKLLESL